MASDHDDGKDAKACELDDLLRRNLAKYSEVKAPTFEDIEADLDEMLNGDYVMCRYRGKVLAITLSGEITPLSTLALSDSGSPLMKQISTKESDNVSLKFETADRTAQYTIKRYTKANRLNYLPNLDGKDGLFPTPDCFDENRKPIFSKMSLENLSAAEKRFEDRKRKDNFVDITLRYNPDGLDGSVRRSDDLTTKVHMIRDGDWLDWFAVGRNGDRSEGDTKMYNELDLFVKRCDDGRYVARIRPDIRSVRSRDDGLKAPRHDIKMESGAGMCDVFEMDPVNVRTMGVYNKNIPNYEKTFDGLLITLLSAYVFSARNESDYWASKVPFSRGKAIHNMLNYKCVKSCDPCGDCAILKTVGTI